MFRVPLRVTTFLKSLALGALPLVAALPAEYGGVTSGANDGSKFVIGGAVNVPLGGLAIRSLTCPCAERCRNRRRRVGGCQDERERAARQYSHHSGGALKLYIPLTGARLPLPF